MAWSNTLCTAFKGNHCIAAGTLRDVALQVKNAMDDSAANDSHEAVLIFNDQTSEVIELDWRGSVESFTNKFNLMAQQLDSISTKIETESTIEPMANKGPGRPKLGVVAREVTLLPRHWEWLASQTGGASVALRKLVEVARLSSESADRVRMSQNAGYKFMSTIAGHQAHFEEASRALFAGKQMEFAATIASWPIDVQTHLFKLLADAFIDKI
ncbi:MAG TPA: DUF2239 family protein [Burkholderiaceae bacterium]|nr:DUF2239 family protein [Burkholderiaceae bacterium]